MSRQEIKTTTKVERLYLAHDNPRHEEVDDEKEAIELLCESENVEQLARDIAVNGINPSERLIVYPADESVGLDEIDRTTAFVVAEGNRRVCALKILHDPELAPVKIRDAITKIADGRDIVEDIDVVVMLDPNKRRHWIGRIHDGVQGGRGRKPWSAEQKTRYSGGNRNTIALKLFDFAQRRGLMERADSKGNLSHMARLVGNVLVADTLGLDKEKGVEELRRNRPIGEFETILTAVLDEAKVKKLGSQASKDDIDRFARNLNKLSGVSVNRIDPEPLDPVEPPEDKPTDEAGDKNNGGGSSGGGDGREKAGGDHSDSKQENPKYVIRDKNISSGFKELNHDKLASLYSSVCVISCEKHTPLIAVGVWSFFETLAATMGSNKPFKDFFNRGKKGKLAELGLGDSQRVKAITDALDRISGYGNITKHDPVSAFYNYRQVINDMKTLTPLVEACIEKLKQNA